MDATVSTSLVACALIVFPTVAVAMVIGMCELILDR